MHKCACGVMVKLSDPNAVVGKDKFGNIIEVICGDCVGVNYPRKRDHSARGKRKKSWGSHNFSGYDE